MPRQGSDLLKVTNIIRVQPRVLRPQHYYQISLSGEGEALRFRARASSQSSRGEQGRTEGTGLNG